MRYRNIFLIICVLPFVTFVITVLGSLYILLCVVEQLLKPFIKQKKEVPTEQPFFLNLLKTFANESKSKRIELPDNSK